ncbi:MAG: ABC transporter ATP-binding protein NatA [Dehalococcoidia bacterium]|nr:ABC transporter ATP-binding protein NatA [Bacillota bacterium]
MDRKIILRARKLKKTFKAGRKQIHAVNDVSFDVYEGEVFALLGPNGAGKTTILKMILGLLTPCAGEMELVGYKIPKQRKRVASEIGAILEGSRNLYWNMTVRENVYYFANLKGKAIKDVKEGMERWAQKLYLSARLDTNVGTLSRGMQQKVALMCALSTSPKFFILDEPLLGLDVVGRFEMEGAIKELTKEATLIVSSHDLRFIERVSDRITVLNNGRIVASGTSSELRKDINYFKYRLILSKKIRSEEYLKHLGLIPGVTVLLQSEDENADAVELTLKGPELIYPVFDILRDFQVVPLEINNLQEPFEEIFVNLIQRGDER